MNATSETDRDLLRSTTLPQPVLETERLVLRGFELADAPAVQALASDRRIAATTLNIPHPYEDGMAEEWIATHAPRFEAGTLANYALVERSSDKLLGTVGLVVKPEHSRAELGYWVGVPFWNRGYATEGARALLEYGFADLGLNRVHASYFVDNPGSGRVMQKLGMRDEGTLRAHVQKWGRFVDVAQYGILRSEWRATVPPA